MASEELSGETSLPRGIEAYEKQRFDEAIKHFENAVAINSGSVQAHLALGATRFTLYKKRPSPPSPDWIQPDAMFLIRS